MEYEKKQAIFYDFDLTLSNMHVYSYLYSDIPDLICQFITCVNNVTNKNDFSVLDLSFSFPEESNKTDDNESNKIYTDIKNKIINEMGDKIYGLCFEYGNKFSMNSKLREKFKNIIIEEKNKYVFDEIIDILAEVLRTNFDTINRIMGRCGITDPNKLYFFKSISELLKQVNMNPNRKITDEERAIINNTFFNGKLELISNHFKTLKEKGVDIYLSSFGVQQHINPILKITGLFDFFKYIISTSENDINIQLSNKNIIIKTKGKNKVENIYKFIEEQKYSTVVYVDDDPNELLKMVSTKLKPEFRKSISSPSVVNCKIIFFGKHNIENLNSQLFIFLITENIEHSVNASNVIINKLDDFDHGLLENHYEQIENVFNHEITKKGGSNYYSKYIKYKKKYASLKYNY